MPRYFFNLYNDITAIDEDGSDWPDDASAIENAVESAREVASANVRSGHLDLKDYIDVLAADGRRVGTIVFGDAVTVLT